MGRQLLLTFIVGEGEEGRKCATIFSSHSHWNSPINCSIRFRCAVSRCADMADCVCVCIPECMCVCALLRFIYLFNAMFCLDTAHCLPAWLTTGWAGGQGLVGGTCDIYTAIILFLWSFSHGDDDDDDDSWTHFMRFSSGLATGNGQRAATPVQAWTTCCCISRQSN